MVSYGNSLLCRPLKNEDKYIGVFIIPSKYNDDTELFEIIEFGKLYKNEHSLNIGDKIIITDSKNNVLIDHDNEKYFICDSEAILAVFKD